MNKENTTQNAIPAPRTGGAATTADANWIARMGQSIRTNHEHRLAKRKLREELASYTSASDLNDLMAMVQQSQDQDTTLIQEVLADKMLAARN